MRLFRSMKTACAPLCAVLALAFAAASAGSIVDGAVHEMDAPHAHNHLSFAETVYDDHHAHGHDHADHDADADGAAHDGDHFGAGHHHHYGDGPTGFVTAVAPALTQHSRSAAMSGRAEETQPPRFAGGAERPPKPLSLA